MKMEPTTLTATVTAAAAIDVDVTVVPDASISDENKDKDINTDNVIILDKEEEDDDDIIVLEKAKEKEEKKDEKKDDEVIVLDEDEETKNEEDVILLRDDNEKEEEKDNDKESESKGVDKKEEGKEKENVVTIPDDSESMSLEDKIERLTNDIIRSSTVSWKYFVDEMNKPPESSEDKKGGPNRSKNVPKKKIIPIEVIDIDEYEEDEKNDEQKKSVFFEDTKPGPTKRVYCFNCGRAGHSGSECKLPLFEEICVVLPRPVMCRKSDWWRKYAMDTVLHGPRIPLSSARGISNFTLLPYNMSPSPGPRRGTSPNQGRKRPVQFCASSDVSDDSDSDYDGSSGKKINGGNATKEVEDIDDEGMVVDFIPVKKFKRG